LTLQLKIQVHILLIHILIYYLPFHPVFLSSQGIIIVLLKTCESKIVLNPSFISGFSDAEGSFVVTILKNPWDKIDWNVQARFQIKLHEKDRALLLLIQNSFYNIGYISKLNDKFPVTKINDIIIDILPFFINTKLKILNIRIRLNLKKRLFLLKIKNI